VPSPVTKADILAALQSNAETITGYFAGIPDARLFDGDPDHWSPAHHLMHLARSSAMVGRALRAGGLRAHPTSRSRPYGEVLGAAASSVAATPRATLLEMGRVVVVEPGTRRADVIAAFERASAELRTVAAEWSEDALDRHALQHPLIGEMTVREMLYFTAFHERHHLRLVKNREEAAGPA
jgi:hypothetical protein